MSITVDKSKIVNFRTDTQLANQAKKIIEDQGFTMSQAFNLFLKNIVVTKDLGLLSEEELEKQELFKKLQAEVQDSFREMEAGHYYTEKELRDYLGI